MMDNLPRGDKELTSDVTEWFQTYADILRHRPVASNPNGLGIVQKKIEAKLVDLGFTVDILAGQNRDEARPVIVAKKFSAITGAPWVVISGHYDVEEAETPPCFYGPTKTGENVPSDIWLTDPFVPEMCDGRVAARGVGDNLGPLLLRLQALVAAERDGSSKNFPGICFVIHGDEEVGSCFAHEVYPTIQLPDPVALFLEESGYFVCPKMGPSGDDTPQQKTQRILHMNVHQESCAWKSITVVAAAARAAGVDVKMEERFMNKANGVEGCPFLKHLVGNGPYISIGPNDTATIIHEANESIPLEFLDLSMMQFVKLLVACADIHNSLPNSADEH